MKINPVKKIKTKETRFSIKRDVLEGVKSASCQFEDLAPCLRYIDKYGFFPNSVLLTVNNKQIRLDRNKYSGRVSFLGGIDYGETKYPQSFSDKRILKQLEKILR